MLFSNDLITALIEDRFEPAWQSVRPVPQVTIDFGNGHVIRRTLHGNVATYVCTADGKVLDILPGVYDPQTYQERLEMLARLHRQAVNSKQSLAAFVQQYHRQRIDARTVRGREPAAEETRGVSIFGIERGTRRTLAGAELRGKFTTVPLASPRPAAGYGGGSVNGQLLAEDTQHNETTRRQRIHGFLAESGLVTPAVISKWLYREVLNSDLDDPYLGLGQTLFANYPFVNEDADE